MQRFKISGIGATLSERSRGRPQYLQPPAPSRLPVDASDLPIRSGGAMAQRDERGMTTVHASPYSDQNASTDSAVWTSPRTWAFGKLRSRTAELIVEAGCAVHGVDLGVRTRLPGGGSR